MMNRRTHIAAVVDDGVGVLEDDHCLRHMESLMRALSNYLLIAALAVLMGQACDRSQADSAREKEIAAEQTSISAYSSKVGEADRYQVRFVEEWTRVNEIKDFRAFKEGIDARVIPALENYVAALKMMPTDSVRLTAAHATILGSFEGSVKAFRDFTKDLSDDNIEERYGQLLKAMEKVSTAEKNYRQKLAQYYAENRVTLVEELALKPLKPEQPGRKIGNDE